MKDEDIKLPEFPASLGGPDATIAACTHNICGATLAHILECYAREAVRLNWPDGGIWQRANAWRAVCKALDDAKPGCLNGPESGVECAVRAIQQMAASPTLAKQEPRPFDLEAAKRGEALVTRDGRRARFIAHVPECAEDRSVLCHIEGKTNASTFSPSGIKYVRQFDGPSGDLFMAPKPKRKAFANTHYYDTEAAARSYAGGASLVAVPVEIEV
ncbi:hypothetical protein y223_00036 [Bordetella phage PY223]